MTEASAPLDFADVYRRHVDLLVAGDLPGVLADMAPGAVPGVFEGVTVPRPPIASARILSVEVAEDRAIGRTVYTAADGEVGLQSDWIVVDGAWKAHALRNIAAESHA